MELDNNMQLLKHPFIGDLKYLSFLMINVLQNNSQNATLNFLTLYSF